MSNNLKSKDNIELENLEGLTNLETVGSGGILIEHNRILRSLEGLQNVSDIAETLSIKKNVLLRNFCAIQNIINSGNVDEIEILENFYNPTIQDFNNGNCSI